jgi:hypothetical protein
MEVRTAYFLYKKDVNCFLCDDKLYESLISVFPISNCTHTLLVTVSKVCILFLLFLLPAYHII